MLEKCTIQKKVKENLYEIEIEDTDGHHCIGCSFEGSCGGKAGKLLARSKKERNTGETAFVFIQEKNELLAVVLVFLVPLLSGLIGALLSNFLFFPENRVFAFVFFAVFLFAAIAILKVKDKQFKKKLPFIVDR